MWNLIISGPNRPQQRQSLRRDSTLLVGRSDDNDVVLPGTSVSRRHAQLLVSQEGIRIADLGSRNGTSLNGRNVGSVPRPLEPGDVAVIGLYALKVERVSDNAALGSDDVAALTTILTNALTPYAEQIRTGPHRSAPSAASEQERPRPVEVLGKLGIGVIHELDGPIQAIASYAQFLKGTTLEFGRLMAQYRTLIHDTLASGSSDARLAQLRQMEEQRGIDDLLAELPNSATTLIQEASRLQALVHAVKDFSRFGLVESVSVDPNRIVAGVVELVRGTYSSLADFETRFAEAGEVICVPRVIYHVLLAVFEETARKLKAVGAKGERIKIRIETFFAAGELCVEVTETNTAPQQLYTTQISDEQETRLITAEQMAQNQGGSFSVKNQLGVGRTFCLRLPIRQ